MLRVWKTQKASMLDSLLLTLEEQQWAVWTGPAISIPTEHLKCPPNNTWGRSPLAMKASYLPDRRSSSSRTQPRPFWCQHIVARGPDYPKPSHQLWKSGCGAPAYSSTPTPVACCWQICCRSPGQRAGKQPLDRTGPGPTSQSCQTGSRLPLRRARPAAHPPCC